MNQEVFINHLKNVECFNDYDFFISSNRYPTFRKKVEDRVLTIGVGDLLEMKIHSIGCHIMFASIESLIQNIDDDWNLNWSPTVKQYIHSSLTGHEFGKGIYGSRVPLSILNENDLFGVTEILTQFYHQDAMPFFNYWGDIRVFIPWLELDYDDINGLNRVFLRDSVLKKIIVWYLTSHPYYERFAQHHEERLKKKLVMEPNNTVIKKRIKRLKTIRTRLEISDPLYQWNPNYLKPTYNTNQDI